MKKSIQFQGAKVFYRIEGNGRPVMLLHGFGEDSSIWDNLIPYLSEYQIIIPDLPGTGASETISKEAVSLDDFALCMADILAQERIDRVHFIGHSMGGYVAMAFANSFPEKLLSLGLFHSSAFADDAEKIAMRKKAIGFIKENGVNAFLKTSIPGLFLDPEHEAVDLLLQKGAHFSAAALIQYYEAMINRKDHSSLLPVLKIPVFFIIGEHDKAIPFKISLQQCYLPKVSFVHILRRSAHMGMCEEPDKITRIVNDFLQEVSRE